MITQLKTLMKLIQTLYICISETETLSDCSLINTACHYCLCEDKLGLFFWGPDWNQRYNPKGLQCVATCLRMCFRPKDNIQWMECTSVECDPTFH